MKDECLICGAPLQYLENDELMECAICHKKESSKTFDKIPTPDVVISMGCDVGCPFIGRAFDANWGLPDPTDKSDADFITVIKQIESNLHHIK